MLLRMQISFVHVQNFRKLKDCRIDFSENQTLFVGANNSGKTTAMDALILFFKYKSKFTTRDFTLSNWTAINEIGKKWHLATEFDEIDLSLDSWLQSLPSLDIWLKVENSELHYIHHLIPTLDWTGGLLGIRLRYEPSNMEELFKEFTSSYKTSSALLENDVVDDFKIWPTSLWDFLDEKSNLNRYFSVHTYLLDPDQREVPQVLSEFDLPVEGDAFSGLIKVDIINAQRGFSDVNSDSSENTATVKNLSSQLRNYYDKHLNPTVNPSSDDIKALRAINDAKKIFDQNLKECFSTSLKELELLNYPGFGNPTINLSSRFNTLDGLNHESAVQYALDDGLSLPEKYNGLGYQNLISIIFKLIRFRDEWMQVGRNYINNASKESADFEPLHLVLIEEPEAHLHAQVQQVFINKAYDVLRNHKELRSSKFRTQLVISTHSSHIAHEASFTSLRYFKRAEAISGKSTTSTVVNLSKTFGTDDATTRFAKRYLKTTHCDLFFADAVIMVEGPAERMLVPYFIKHHSKLDNCYLSILEIGGSHAHTLQQLVENLSIFCLIITDIDSTEGKSKVQPDLGKGFLSGNNTLKNWIPKISSIDKLLKLDVGGRADARSFVKVSYQLPIKIKGELGVVEVYPYTFEDSLVMTNRQIFAELSECTGLLKKMTTAAKDTDIANSAKQMYEAITASSAKKAEFALELLYLAEPIKLTAPEYIAEGLSWLEKKLVADKSILTI